MAKTSQINRNKKREKMVAHYAAKRAASALAGERPLDGIGITNGASGEPLLKLEDLLELAVRLRLGEGAAADARIEEVRGFAQGRDRQAERQVDDAVLDLAILGDQHHQCALGLEPHEFDVLEPHIGLCGEHDPGRMGEARQKPGRLAQHVIDRLAGRRDQAKSSRISS